MTTISTADPAGTAATFQSVPLELKPQVGYQSMFPINEGDLWRWQLETLTELTRFIKAHAPGKPGALPVVAWQLNTGFQATARLSKYDGPSETPRDLRAVLDAYAEVLGSEVTSADLGPGRGTQYRVKGTIPGQRRIELLLIADISADDEQVLDA